jgi:hypothetical protein
VGGLVSNKLPFFPYQKRIGRNGGEGGPPYFNGKGGIAVSQPFLYNYLSPRGHRRRKMSGTGPSVVTPLKCWFFLDMEIDPEIEIYIFLSIDRYIEKWI